MSRWRAGSPRGPILLAALWVAACVAARAGEPPKPEETAPGNILCEFYENIPGNSVAELTAHPSFDRAPTSCCSLSSFEVPTDRADNYGTRVRGWLHPPSSGEYVFWIASDDNSELWLSTDATPEKKVKIACVSGWTAPRAWTASPEQQSKPVRLEAGKKYYVEALHKEGGGNDNLAVGWKLPDNQEERPIPGSRLSGCKPIPIPLPPPPQVIMRSVVVAPAAGHYKLVADVMVQGQTMRIPYLIYLPKDYDPAKDKRALLMFLHGAGEGGADLQGLFSHGPSAELSRNAQLREQVTLIVFSPQSPGLRWEQPQFIQAVLALLDQVCRDFAVDEDRVYCTGLSMGGTGTWHFALAAPERFAAIAPVAGAAVAPELAREKLARMAVWILSGAADGGYTEGAHQMAKALENSKPKAELTEIPGEGHGVWSRYYPKPEFYEWLLKHRRPPGVARPKPPAPEGVEVARAAAPAALPEPAKITVPPAPLSPPKPVPPPAQPPPQGPTETARKLAPAQPPVAAPAPKAREAARPEATPKAQSPVATAPPASKTAAPDTTVTTKTAQGAKPTAKSTAQPRVFGAYGPHARAYIVATFAGGAALLLLTLYLLARRPAAGR